MIAIRRDTLGRTSVTKWLAQRFELSRGGDHNVGCMEGIRGLAVSLVFFVHFASLIAPWIADNSALLVLSASMHAIGNAGVDLFFVLSGYLIYGSLISRPQRFSKFMFRRVERIYPAFLAVFGFYVALSIAFPGHSKLPSGHAQAAVYLLQNLLLLPGLLPIEPMITVAWSLSYELFFYLVIPILIAVLRLRARTSRWRVMLFLAIAVMTATYVALYGGHVRLIMFISGILLYEAMIARRLPPTPRVAFVALFAGLASMLLPFSGSAWFAVKISMLFAAFFASFWVCFTYPQHWLTRALSWTPMRWLGNMSYSYYLIHGLTLKAAFLALPMVFPFGSYGWWFYCISLVTTFGLTLASAVTLFLIVERPLSLARHSVVNTTERPLVHGGSSTGLDADHAAANVPR